MGAAEGLALRGALHLHEVDLARGDHVHVHLRRGVLLVVEVEADLPAHDPHADGGDVAADVGAPFTTPALWSISPPARAPRTSGDGRGAGAAVRLSTSQSMVRVRARARRSMRRRARPGRSAAGSPACGRPAPPAPFGGRALVRGAGQHAVLRGHHPAPSAASREAGPGSPRLAVQSTWVSPKRARQEPWASSRRSHREKWASRPASFRWRAWGAHHNLAGATAQPRWERRG